MAALANQCANYVASWASGLDGPQCAYPLAPVGGLIEAFMRLFDALVPHPCAFRRLRELAASLKGNADETTKPTRGGCLYGVSQGRVVWGTLRTIAPRLSDELDEKPENSIPLSP